MENRWQLYEKGDYEAINAALDNRFNDLISAAKTQIEAGEDPSSASLHVITQMEEFMDSIDGYGASDTEPRAVLVALTASSLSYSEDQMEQPDQLQLH